LGESEADQPSGDTLHADDHPPGGSVVVVVVGTVEVVEVVDVVVVVVDVVVEVVDVVVDVVDVVGSPQPGGCGGAQPTKIRTGTTPAAHRQTRPPAFPAQLIDPPS
jgi:hypothetical protein